MRRHLGNVLIRARRDLRLLLVDRYRALLFGPYAAAAALVAGLVDRAFGALHLVRTIRRRRSAGVPPPWPQLVRVAIGAGDVLSVTVGGVPTGPLTLRAGDRTLDLAAVRDAGAATTRYVASLPAEAADGTDWTVAVGTAGLVVTDHAALPAEFGTMRGRLVLHGRAEEAVGLEHTVEVGVRTAVIRWTGGSDAPLTIGDAVLPRAGDDTAEVDLTTIGTGVVRLGGAPLALRPGRWSTDAGPTVPPPVRVVAGGRRFEIGYTSAGHLEFRPAPAAAAAWA